MTLNKTIQKPSLNSSPFIKMFELGQNNEGYWTYNHMVLQLEDCIDCLQVVHPEFDYVFLFDHSSGHAKKRKDGLDGGNMLRGYGGSQALMHSSEMKEVDGYLGSYPRVLEKGDSQSMVFCAADEGPFWMSQEEKEEKRNKVFTGESKTRDKRISELLLELTPKGVELAKKK